MRVAIAAGLFDDTTKAASHRARALAEELASLGHEVTVLAPQTDNPAPPPVGVKVWRLPPHSNLLLPQQHAAKLALRLLAQLVTAPTVPTLACLRLVRSRGSSKKLDDRWTHVAERRYSSVLRLEQLMSLGLWSRTLKRQLSALGGRQSLFDVVVSTSAPMGRAIRDSGLALAWVNDFRDPMPSPSFLGLLNLALRRMQNKDLRDADVTTAVSEGVAASLAGKGPRRRKRSPIVILTNGFRERDPKLRQLPEAREGGTLRIGYTGEVSPRQRPELLRFLQSAGEARKTFPGGNLEFHYAGRAGVLVRQLAEEAGMADATVLHGRVDHARSLELQSEMDELLVLSHNNPGNEGILSGKFLEYLDANRPIIAAVGGSLPGSELRSIIEKTRVGVCSERAAGDGESARLVLHIVEGLRAKTQGENLAFEPDRTEVGRYSYTAIAKRLSELLEELFD